MTDITYESNNDIRYQKIQEQIEETKNVVINNLDLALHRSSNIDIIAQDTENLKNDSIEFNTSANILKKELRKKRIKQILCSIFVVLVIILILTLIICEGFLTNKCK